MITIIDYDAGNTCSVMNALKRLNVNFELSDDPATILKAEKVIFPGVGHAAAAMEALKAKNLVDVIRSLRQPVLGICVGMQLLMDSSEEGDAKGLGIIPGKVLRFDVDPSMKVPHMGWNSISDYEDTRLLKDIPDNSYVYFVHSYYVPENAYSIANCSYGLQFSAAVKKDNFYGIQFHAEKSGSVGAEILQNFIINT
jgi:glutamine amidotransferase